MVRRNLLYLLQASLTHEFYVVESVQHFKEHSGFCKLKVFIAASQNYKVDLLPGLAVSISNTKANSAFSFAKMASLYLRRQLNQAYS